MPVSTFSCLIISPPYGRTRFLVHLRRFCLLLEKFLEALFRDFWKSQNRKNWSNLSAPRTFKYSFLTHWIKSIVFIVFLKKTKKILIIENEWCFSLDENKIKTLFQSFRSKMKHNNGNNPHIINQNQASSKQRWVKNSLTIFSFESELPKWITRPFWWPYTFLSSCVDLRRFFPLLDRFLEPYFADF